MNRSRFGDLRRFDDEEGDEAVPLVVVEVALVLRPAPVRLTEQLNDSIDEIRCELADNAEEGE